MITKNDLELLGFAFLKKEDNKNVFINENKLSRDEKIYLGESYENERYIAIQNNCGDFYFKGWVKNIEELKIILIQIKVRFNNSNKETHNLNNEKFTI